VRKCRTVFFQYYEQNAHVLLVDDGDALQGGYVGISTRGESIKKP